MASRAIGEENRSNQITAIIKQLERIAGALESIIANAEPASGGGPIEPPEAASGGGPIEPPEDQ